VARPVAVLLDVHEPVVRAVIAAECPATVELRMATSADPGDRTALARDAAFFVGGITPIPASMMDAAPALRLIHKWGIGVDKIDLAAARARGIPVAITAGANAVAVAEFTLLLMLAVLRRLPYREAQLRSGEWNRARGETRLEARQLRGKLVGLVRLGGIGRQVAKRLQAFDTEVRYFDIRRPTPAEEQALGVRFQALDGLLSEVDIVSLHVPYTPATRRMLSREQSRGSGRGRSSSTRRAARSSTRPRSPRPLSPDDWGARDSTSSAGSHRARITPCSASGFPGSSWPRTSPAPSSTTWPTSRATCSGTFSACWTASPFRRRTSCRWRPGIDGPGGSASRRGGLACLRVVGSA
jgi:D-isomer specific 2-hydroxyacid dehydrogenase, NAD binding domain